MKITRRQLRQLIKEEIGDYEKLRGMERQGIDPVMTIPLSGYHPESERPDYPESDPDKPFQVSRSEFEADNKQEIKLLVSYLRPVINNMIDRMMTWVPDVIVTKEMRDHAINYMNKEMKEMVTQAAYMAMWGDEKGVSLEALLPTAKKLASSPQAVDKLLREFELALTSDADSGEPIIDKDTIKTALSVFKANLGL